uniref:Uncharacterized protein LOC105649749 isoform X3 n=1 Tax=Rhizophora mucronata TaxID=61149 RepID=A0A2P2LZC6_RHIMU
MFDAQLTESCNSTTHVCEQPNDIMRECHATKNIPKK